MPRSPKFARPALLALLCLAAGSARAENYQVAHQLMPLIPPGTVIGRTAPGPWTHIIIKSHPRCTQGDLAKVAASNVEMASLLTTSILAEVRQVAGPDNRPRFILYQLAGGVSKRIQGQDVVITPDTQRQLGANLGFLQGILLKEFVGQQKTVKFVARGESLAMFDTPIVLRTNDRNEPMVLRYAVIVDPRGGELNTLCWPIRLNGNAYAGVAGPMQWLPQNHIIDCQLWVDASEYRFGIPSKEAFACVSVPPGQVQINLPQNVASLLSKQQLTAADCGQADQWLRGVVQQAQARMQQQNPSSRPR